MKKLLILMLVLGLASTASAVPVIVGPTEIDIAVGYITLTLEGTAAEASKDGGGTPYGGYEGAVWVDYAAYSGQISDVVGPTSNMGGLGAIDEGYMDGTYNTGGGPVFTAGYLGDWTEGIDVDEGSWFTFRVSMLGGAEVDDTYDVQVLNSGWGIETGVTHTVTVIPEPMTIALLGLGGLFLRRRR